MQKRISCNAAFKLLHCGRGPYIGLDDSAFEQELNLEFKETTHAALAHSIDPGVPRLSAQRRRIVPADRSGTGRYWTRSLGHSARCSGQLQRLKFFSPDRRRTAPALGGRCRIYPSRIPLSDETRYLCAS